MSKKLENLNLGIWPAGVDARIPSLYTYLSNSNDSYRASFYTDSNWFLFPGTVGDEFLFYDKFGRSRITHYDFDRITGPGANGSLDIGRFRSALKMHIPDSISAKLKNTLMDCL